MFLMSEVPLYCSVERRSGRPAEVSSLCHHQTIHIYIYVYIYIYIYIYIYVYFYIYMYSYMYIYVYATPSASVSTASPESLVKSPAPVEK